MIYPNSSNNNSDNTDDLLSPYPNFTNCTHSSEQLCILIKTSPHPQSVQVYIIHPHLTTAVIPPNTSTDNHPHPQHETQPPNHWNILFYWNPHTCVYLVALWRSHQRWQSCWPGGFHPSASSAWQGRRRTCGRGGPPPDAVAQCSDPEEKGDKCSGVNHTLSKLVFNSVHVSPVFFFISYIFHQCTGINSIVFISYLFQQCTGIKSTFLA